jgi:hypothetical protein
VLGLDDTGETTYTLKAGPRALFERCGNMLNTLVGQAGETRTVPWREWFDTCVAVLAANYRINGELAAMLGVFDTSNVFTVLATAMDLDKLAAVANPTEKKTG